MRQIRLITRPKQYGKFDVDSLTSLKVLTRELNGTTFEAFWASLSFMLAVVVTQPMYTSASDILGRKPLLYSAFILFFVGSIVFAVGNSMTVVIVGRLIQGLGGGGLDVLNEVIICDLTTLQERPFWLSLFAVPMATGCILGPIIGAAFSEYASWRWIGWINLPLVAISAVGAVFFMHLKPMDEPLRSRFAKLDWIGMVLFTIGCVAFSLPLSWGGSLYPWSSWRTIVPLVIGFVVLVVFGIYERRPEYAVMPYRFFKNRSSLATLVGSFVHGIVLYPSLFYLPLFFQAVFLETPLSAAVSILPLVCVLIFFSLFSGLLVDHLRHYLWQLWAAWITTAVGTGLFALWGPEVSLAERAGFQVLAAIGLGIQFVVPSVAIQASVSKPEDHGLSVGLLVCFRLFGALIGLAVASTAFSSAFGHYVASLEPLPPAISPLRDPANAVGFIPYLRTTVLPAHELKEVQEAYSDALKVIWYIMAGFSSFGFLSSLLVRELSIETTEVGRQHLEEAVV